MQQVADWLEKLGLGQYVERFEPLKGCSTLAASSSCSRPGEPNGILKIIRGSFGKYMMITTPLVALFTDWSEVRRLPLLIVAGSITLLSSILVVDRQVDAQSQTATGHREDSSDLTAVVNSGVKDKIDLGTISKAIVNEASRLKNDVVGWDQKLHELDLDLDLKKRKQDFQGMAKDIDECLAVLRAAANRLTPDAEARETFRKQESALREVASRAEVQSDPAIRSTAAYFQQKTIELRALSRSVEETRIELTTQIDRLEAQLRFNAGAGQMSELVRGGRNILTGIQAIAANAQQLANDLAGPHGTPAAAAQPAGTTRTPSAVAKPAATNPAHR